jgi:flavin reductase (DIM6/NTAB) family NADH-FMN oxidoreductase RutF
MSDDFHTYEPRNGHGLPHDPFNAIVGPRPIGWIGSVSADGRHNLAPYSFFNAFNYIPPILGFSSVGKKDSVRNIEATGCFTWNLVSGDLATPMNLSSSMVPPEVDEFVLAGLTAKRGDLVAAPRVAESPVTMECRLIEVHQLKTAEQVPVNSWVVFGEVVKVHIRRDLLKDGIYQTTLPEPILRTGGPGGYVRVDARTEFQMFRPDQKPKS